MSKLIRNPLISFLSAFLIILLFGLIAMWSLIKSPFYTSHDGFTHTARIAAYYGALKDNQIPPRWAKNLNGTLGSPIFTYSYPAPYFLGSLLHSQKISYEDSFRLVMALGYLFSGIFAYLWLKNKFGQFPALVGAIVFLWAPYRFLNIYVRGAIAENLAHAFLPLILLAIEKLFSAKNKSLWSILLTLSFSAMLLSHNVVSAMFMPIALGWTTVLWLQKRDNRPFIFVIFSIIFSFAISAFIYAPDLLERNFIHFDAGISYYSDHFVTLKQLIYSPWGYGFDLPGWINDGMSFQLGLANIMMLGMLTLFLLYRIIKNKKEIFQKREIELGFWLLLFSLIVFLTVQNPLSLPIWHNTPVLKTIVDFPWRFLGLVPLIFAFLFAYLLKNVNKFRHILGTVFLIAILVANRNNLRVNEAVIFGDSAFDNYSGTSTASSNEYTPYWRSNKQFPFNAPRIALVTGLADFKVISNTASELVFSVFATEPAIVRINRFYFPDTKIYKDGKELVQDSDWSIIKTRTTPVEPDVHDDTGLIQLKVQPPGGRYVLRFSETPIREWSNRVSAISFLAIAVFSILIFVRKRVKA